MTPSMRRLIGLVEAPAAPPLFHTTSPHSALAILTTRTLQARDADSFVSLSEIPLPSGDIRENGCTLVFHPSAFGAQLVAVDYTEAWFDAHPMIGAYIAGEGWREQYVIPDDLTDADGWEDEDAVEADYRDHELAAFLDKAAEHEHVSLDPGGAVRFAADGVLAVLTHDDGTADWRAELARLGYTHVRVRSGSRWPGDR